MSCLSGTQQDFSLVWTIFKKCLYSHQTFLMKAELLCIYSHICEGRKKNRKKNHRSVRELASESSDCIWVIDPRWARYTGHI